MVDEVVKWFSGLDRKDYSSVGIMGAGLGELYRKKYPVVPGFAVTNETIKKIAKNSKVQELINGMLMHIPLNNQNELERSAKRVQELMLDVKIDDNIKEEILEAVSILNVRGRLDNANTFLHNAEEFPKMKVIVSAKNSELQLIVGIKTFIANNKDEFFNAIVQSMAESYSAEMIIKKAELGIHAGEIVTSPVIEPYIEGYAVEASSREYEDSKSVKVSVGDELALIKFERKEDKIDVSYIENEKFRKFDDLVARRFAFYAMHVEDNFNRPQKVQFTFKEHPIITAVLPLKLPDKKQVIKEGETEWAPQGLQKLFSEGFEEKRGIKGIKEKKPDMEPDMQPDMKPDKNNEVNTEKEEFGVPPDFSALIRLEKSIKSIECPEVLNMLDLSLEVQKEDYESLALQALG